MILFSLLSSLIQVFYSTPHHQWQKLSQLKRDLQNLSWLLSRLVMFFISFSFLQGLNVFKVQQNIVNQTVKNLDKSIQKYPNLFSLLSLTCFEKMLSAWSGKEWPINHILRRDTTRGGQITIRRTFVQLRSSKGHQKWASKVYLVVCIISGFSSEETIEEEINSSIFSMHFSTIIIFYQW